MQLPLYAGRRAPREHVCFHSRGKRSSEHGGPQIFKCTGVSMLEFTWRYLYVSAACRSFVLVLPPHRRSSVHWSALGCRCLSPNRAVAEEAPGRRPLDRHHYADRGWRGRRQGRSAHSVGITRRLRTRQSLGAPRYLSATLADGSMYGPLPERRRVSPGRAPPVGRRLRSAALASRWPFGVVMRGFAKRFRRPSRATSFMEDQPTPMGQVTRFPPSIASQDPDGSATSPPVAECDRAPPYLLFVASSSAARCSCSRRYRDSDLCKEKTI